MMKRIIPVAGAMCLLAALPAFAQTTAQHNARTELSKGALVVIEGCVAAGEKANTYVLGHVTEVQAVNVALIRKRIYWLDSTKHIKGHVGHQVRISGKVTDLERSEIEIDLGAGKNGGAVAKLEGPGGSEVKTPVANVIDGAAARSDADVPTTLVKIKVSKVTRLAGRCPKP